MRIIAQPGLIVKRRKGKSRICIRGISCFIRYSISNSIGLSISSETYLPFFLRWRTHSVRRYSICPLIDRKSSSAQAAIASYSFADTLSGICFLELISLISVEASRIHYRLSITVSAEYNEQIGNHCGLSFLIEFDNSVLRKTLKRHFHHADRAVNNHLARVDNG